MKNHIISAFLSFILIFSFAGVSFGAKSDHPEVPKLTSPVYDETGSLTPEQADALRRKLLANEDSTSTQIAIVIVNSLNDNPVSDYAFEIGNQNKIGQGKKNNGAVILISKSDRKGFIATGQGMEPTLTDAVCNYIYQNILRPSLANGDFYGGLDKSVDAIIKATAGEFKAEPQNRLSSRPQSSKGGALVIVLVFFIILMIVRAVIGAGSRRTVIGSKGGMSGCMNGLLQGLFWSSIFSNRGKGGGWGSGGGFGSGGFGGGGGGWSGGGGSFGGGGAGGDW